MMRSRVIHPDICTDARLGKLDPWAQILFPRLWMLADREGRFKWDPEEIHAKTLHFFYGDFGALLAALCKSGVIRRYTVDFSTYGDIPNFLKYQRPHPREAKSVIPPCPKTVDQLSLPFSDDSIEENLGQTLGEPRFALGQPRLPVSISISVLDGLDGHNGGDRGSMPGDSPPIVENEPRNTGAKRDGFKTRGANPEPKEHERKPPDRQQTVVHRKPPQRETRERPPKTAGLDWFPHKPQDITVVRDSLQALGLELRHMQPPDDVIVRRVLDAARGADAREIHAFLVELHKRGKFRSMYSWGLLPPLIEQRFHVLAMAAGA